MRERLFNIFFFLFVFLMFNRELNVFGFDLRIFAALLGVLILFLNILSIKDLKEKKIKISGFEKTIIAFYIISLLTNLMWKFNGLTLNNSGFKVIFISYVFNFEFFLVFALNKKYFTLKKLWNNIFISSLVLLFSMICANLGIDIQRHIFSGCRGYVQDLATNFLGGKYRIAGYAEDPNYASLFMIISFATCVYFRRKTKTMISVFDVIYYMGMIFGFLLSASKTVLVALLIALIMCNLKRLKSANYFLIIFAILGPIAIILLNVNLFSSMVTMSQRFMMWNKAVDLFFKNPIIGSGLTSFRSYFLSNGYWYVQCHSTIFQILSETGAICLILFMVLLIKNAKIDNKYMKFITILYTISMITTETVYHAYFIFIVGILPLIIKELDKNEEKN